MYPRNMVCFRYIIVNNLHKGTSTTTTTTTIIISSSTISRCVRYWAEGIL
jgi:hypothetical protein